MFPLVVTVANIFDKLANVFGYQLEHVNDICGIRQKGVSVRRLRGTE